MVDPILLPGFDFEKFPYVFARVKKSKIYLINVREESIQVLLDVDSRSQGVCVETTGRNFDFHFMSMKYESDNKWYSYSHKLEFRSDLIDFMEKCGGIPAMSIADSHMIYRSAKET